MKSADKKTMVKNGRYTRQERCLGNDSGQRLKIMNVIDVRQKVPRTIAFLPGSIITVSDGFTYSFQYRTSDGMDTFGAGIVVNPRYASMSPEKIELLCSVENPVSAGDISELTAKFGLAAPDPEHTV